MRIASFIALASLCGLLLSISSVVHAVPIPGAMLWLDASNSASINGGTPSNNDPVSLWGDSSSGAASDATQGTAARQPLWIQTSSANGRSVVRFDGSPTAGLGDRLGVTGLALGVNATIFVVTVNQTQTSGGSSVRPVIVENTNYSANGYGVAYAQAPEEPITYFSKNGAHFNPAISYDEQYHFLTRRSAASSQQAFDNSVSLGTSSIAGTPTGTAYTVGGEANNDTRHYLGDIGEIVAYNAALNTAELAITHNYLSAKYNIGNTTVGISKTLGANDRYAGDLDTNGDYDYDVFGIGSESTGTVSTGSYGSGLSLAEAAASLTAGEYVLAGRDNSNPSGIVTTDLAGSGTATRLERIWYLDKTGLVDATITFNLDDLGLAVVLNNDYDLLYRTGTSGNFTNLGLLASISGDDVSFLVPNGDLNDGFYTLAITPPVPEPSTFALLCLGIVGWATRRVRKAKARHA